LDHRDHIINDEVRNQVGHW